MKKTIALVSAVLMVVLLAACGGDNSMGEDLDTTMESTTQAIENTIQQEVEYRDFDLRDYIWTHQNEYKGRVVEVKYQAITTNAKGERKLQFPVFVCIRPLGKEVNEED